MTEPLVDLRGLLRSLHEHGVDYVVLGAIAMIIDAIEQLADL